MTHPNLLEQRFDILACPACHGELAWQAQDTLLRCTACQAEYPIIDRIVHFISPEQLSGYNRRFARMYDRFSWFYRLFSQIAFALIGMREGSGRRKVLQRLEPEGGRLLEISIGPGVNLPYLLPRPDVGEVYGLDISLGQLKRCRSLARRKGWDVPLYLANAEALPFKDETFDSILHIGGINFFNDKQAAINEMIRVARTGTRLVIVDETEKAAKGYERSIPGFKSSFSGPRQPVNAPAELVPEEMLEKRLYEVWKGWFYCLEFRKP